MDDLIFRDRAWVNHAPPDDEVDSWRQIGVVVRPLIRRLGLPLPTARLVLENAGVRLEAP